MAKQPKRRTRTAPKAKRAGGGRAKKGQRTTTIGGKRLAGSQGIVRKALIAELDRLGMNRRQLAIKAGVPGTVVFEYLRTDGKGRDGVSLRNAEAMLHAAGITLAPGKAPAGSAAKDNPADDPAPAAK